MADAVSHQLSVLGGAPSRQKAAARAASRELKCYTRGTTDVEPVNRITGSAGGHAKWVQSPRGAATVSGELHFRSRYRPAATVRRHGKARNAIRSASQDT